MYGAEIGWREDYAVEGHTKDSGWILILLPYLQFSY